MAASKAKRFVHEIVSHLPILAFAIALLIIISTDLTPLFQAMSQKLFIVLTSPFNIYIEGGGMANVAWTALAVAIAEIYFKLTDRPFEVTVAIISGIVVTYIFAFTGLFLNIVASGTSIVSFTALLFLAVNVIGDMLNLPRQILLGNVSITKTVVFMSTYAFGVVGLFIFLIPSLGGDYIYGNPSWKLHLVGGVAAIMLTLIALSVRDKQKAEKENKKRKAMHDQYAAAIDAIENNPE
jgi:hypothetical protein